MFRQREVVTENSRPLQCRRKFIFFLPFSRVGLILEMESITPGICVSFALEEVRLFYR